MRGRRSFLTCKRHDCFKFGALFLLIFVAFACSDSSRTKEYTASEKEYKLVERDSLFFRRAYWGHDTLEGSAWDVFMNRNPEVMATVIELEKHEFVKELTEANIIQDGNLNLSEIDTLPKSFNFQIASNRKVNVETRLIDDPKQVDDLTYELTFKEENKVLLIDSLICGFPPDVTFLSRDLQNDGSHELITIFRWYIVNGDNYDLRIYNLIEKEKPYQSSD